MKRIEFLERIKAAIGGYFWLECPNCHRMFGGHEAAGPGLFYGGVYGKTTCGNPECVADVRAKMAQFWTVTK